MLKQKLKIFSIFSFFFSLIFTFTVGEIFYNSIDGTDFYRYFRYIEYFNGTIETTSREQGLFYFWIISLFIDSYDQFYDEHVYVFSTLSISKVVEEFGLRLFHAERIETHGGSMRYYICKKDANYKESKNLMSIFKTEKNRILTKTYLRILRTSSQQQN